MSVSKFVLAKVKVNGEMKDIVAKSDGENTTVNYRGKEMTLNSALGTVGNEIAEAGVNIASDSEVRNIFK